MPQSRLGDEPTLFTVGYQGRELEGFLDILKQSGISLLVDVRENAWSRKPGFSKTPLEEALQRRGIRYEHLRSLGTPRETRRALREGALDSFEEAYMDHLDEEGDALARLTRAAEQDATAIMCMERDAKDCHRRFLGKRFVEEGWRVIHL